jgi:hypothetical protein
LQNFRPAVPFDKGSFHGYSSLWRSKVACLIEGFKSDRRKLTFAAVLPRRSRPTRTRAETPMRWHGRPRRS